MLPLERVLGSRTDPWIQAAEEEEVSMQEIEIRTVGAARGRLPP